MSLRDDINAGLAVISTPNTDHPLMLDDSGYCPITVFMPASVVKQQNNHLLIQVKISRTGRFFSLLSPIGIITEKPSQEFLEALFYRQFYADQVSGVSLAINAEDNGLVAVYHWMLESITPNDFASLFQRFVTATLALLKELSNRADVVPSLMLK